MAESSAFYGLGIAPNILTVLDKLGFKTPTPIQEKSIPPGLEGKDMVGLAQTGTGKTLAFGIPMIQAALGGKQGLVILPTRELAAQVEETIRKIGGPLGIKTAVLVGGESMHRQLAALRRNPQIVICTPGRMIDHLEQKTISLKNIGILVLDEADRMLDMGFAPQLERILRTVPKERQTMLFSATMPQNIVGIANSYMKLPLRIEIAPSGTTTDKVTQEVFFIAKPDKSRLLEKLLYEYRGSVLVFSRTKHGAKKIAAGLRALGHAAAEIHSNKSLNQRREALEGFRNGKYRVLVATDIAARGIDVKGIELVLNYDLPTNPEDYVHRIGRTARAGATGHAISFAEPNQKGDVRSIERLMRVNLPLKALPELPPVRPGMVEAPSYRPYRPYNGPSRGAGGRPSYPPRGAGGPAPHRTGGSGYGRRSSNFRSSGRR
jgi:ATP-dependent RNA helicase RhlE